MRHRPLTLLLLATLPGVVSAQQAETLSRPIATATAAPLPMVQQAPRPLQMAPTLSIPTRKDPAGAALPSSPATTAVVVPAAGAVAAAPVSTVAAVPTVDDPQFPHLPILKPAVAFWTQVFAEYSENQSVVHSIDDVRKVYTVLDFRSQAAVMDPGVLGALRSREERQAKADVDTLLKQVNALRDEPEKMNVEQRRIYDLYSDSKDPDRFTNAIGSFRAQRGLRERTMQALTTSGRYLPEMERIFVSYGLPPKLTRLPLVESSFRVDAYSKAAAAGLWQFIPSSARIYMRLNNLVDDRRDPWTSTDAAARHLKDDYETLGNWPLALTAYNYGRSGVKRALTEVNGDSLTDMIQRFNGKRFGFASRNYYAEFVAAADIEREWQKHFGDVPREKPTPFEMVTVQDYVPYETLRKLCGADRDQFQALNPAYRDEVVEGRLYVPPGHTIRVPAGAAERFRLAYATLTPSQRFDHQRQFFFSHVVGRGESVASLAHRYGVSVRAILNASGISNAKRVKRGSTLRIPTGPAGDDGEDVAKADPVDAAPEVHEATVRKVKTVVAAHSVAATRVHRVTAGQTLDGIAKRYRTTIQALRALNGMGRHETLQVGDKLKIPAA
jgi:membrane-bound lytic murein transglycosylase D